MDDEGNFIGFDAIIGNPPYIQLQSLGEVTDIYGQMNYQTFERTGDIYCLFYELGNDLLRPNYFLSFITSNKWMRAGYGESMRKYFVEQTNPVLLVDFPEINVFDEATVDVNILIYQKDKNRQQTQACIIKKEGIKNLSVFIRQNNVICSFKTSESWIILSPIEQSIKQKIESIGMPLKDWEDIQINYGVKTGFNDAFIINGKKRKELIEQDHKSAEIIRPILRGRDIKRYGYQFADLWLINTHNGIKEKGIKPINIEDYPAVKNHLDKFYAELEKRQDKGDTPYNLRNCAYIDDFYKQKIIWKIIGNQMAFSIDSNEYVVNNACYILTGSCLEYLLSVLNSNVIKWYSYITNMNKTGVGDVQVGGQNVNLFPIPILSDSEQNTFIELVKEILIKKGNNEKTAMLEAKIDNLIYEMYGLSIEEIQFINSL